MDKSNVSYLAILHSITNRFHLLCSLIIPVSTSQSIQNIKIVSSLYVFTHLRDLDTPLLLFYYSFFNMSMNSYDGLSSLFVQKSGSLS